MTPEEIAAATGTLQYEIHGDEPVPPGAKALHEEGRAAGAKGDYDQALTLLTKAADLAPRWPYPVYDRAFTHLLMKDFDAALADYKRAQDLAPGGFFTTLTAVDTLTREQKGEFPRGLYLAYVMLEPVGDPAQRRTLVQQFVDKYPRFAPGWEQFAKILDDPRDRLKAIENGLSAAPDPETKGMLELNKALTLHGSGDRDGAVRILSGLIAAPESTLATETLAKAMLARIKAR